MTSSHEGSSESANTVVSLSRFFFRSYLRLAEFELCHFGEYAEKFERFLAQEQKSFRASVDKKAESLDEEEKADFYDWMSEDYSKLNDLFPNILRASLFTHIYSFTEHHLVKFCDHYHGEKKYRVAPSDLRGEGIGRSKDYLKKVVGIPFPDNTVNSPSSGRNATRSREYRCSDSSAA